MGLEVCDESLFIQVTKKMAMSERKCAYIAYHGIYPHFKAQFRQKIGDKKYVLLFDESLNNMTQRKQLDVYVRMWQHDTVVSRFYGSSFMGHAKATDMLQVLT